MKKRSKFLIVCAVVFAVGAVLFIAGLAGGALDGVANVAEDHSWIQSNMGDMEVKNEEWGEIKELNIETCDADVIVVHEDYAGALRGVENATAGMVHMMYPEDSAVPACSGGDGVLNISFPDNFNGISLNFGDSEPALVVVCGDEIEKISVTAGTGDVECTGLSDAAVKIEQGNGDIEMNDCAVASLEIVSETGDVEFYSSEDRSLFAILAESETGDIEIDGTDCAECGGRWSAGTGNRRLTISTGSGDIEMAFTGTSREDHHDDHDNHDD